MHIINFQSRHDPNINTDLMDFSRNPNAFIVEERIKLALVGFWIDTALLVCLNSASAALVIAASASDTQSVEVVDLGM